MKLLYNISYKILRTVLILFVLVEGFIYRTPLKNGDCAITNYTTHEKCLCTGIDSCKPRCNTDFHCKGFAKHRKGDACSFATTSNCPPECNKFLEGNSGILLPDSENSSGFYSGCYIKQTRNLS